MNGFSRRCGRRAVYRKVVGQLAAGRRWTSARRCTLQYFGLNNDSCTASDYATPEIALTAMPAGEANLATSLNNHAPSTNTPTSAAADGLTMFTTAQKTASPNRSIIGILITDGDPTVCNTSPSYVGGLISTAWNNGAGVRTYVIGMTGATLANLETMAQGGGAPSHTQYCSGSTCHYYNVGSGDYATFTGVLTAIRDPAVGCDYALPAGDGGSVDPASTSIDYLPAGSPPASAIPRVNDVSSCPAPGSGQDGWYFDDNTNGCGSVPAHGRRLAPPAIGSKPAPGLAG